MSYMYLCCYLYGEVPGGSWNEGSYNSGTFAPQALIRSLLRLSRVTEHSANVCLDQRGDHEIPQYTPKYGVKQDKGNDKCNEKKQVKKESWRRGEGKKEKWMEADGVMITSPL